jgi:Cu-Zn family superoxide dismutase
VVPEGIAVRDGTYYVGSVEHGDIYRGDLAEPRAAVFIRGGEGHSTAAGIEATATRLVVANGNEGATVFDRSTGKLLARFSVQEQAANVNDIATTPNGDTYLTDFALSRIYRVPAAGIGRTDGKVQQLPVFLDLAKTDFLAIPNSANGIVATPDGKYLIVAHFSQGALYRVSVSDKRVKLIDMHGGTVASPDGLVLADNKVLYAIENSAGTVAAIRMTDSYDSGEVLSHTGDKSFNCPTTAALAGDRLLVVNNQYCSGQPTPPFTVTSIPAP